jgi:hypothetical protein
MQKTSAQTNYDIDLPDSKSPQNLKKQKFG